LRSSRLPASFSAANILRNMKQVPDVIEDAVPGNLTFVRTGGGDDGLQRGLAQGVLQAAALLLQPFQRVTQCH
jgi:hypothetical protein